LIYAKSYQPYADELRLRAEAPVLADGYVVKAYEPVREDYYYYGPLVEFTMPNGITVRSEAVSPIRSRRQYAVGDRVLVGYTGEMNSDIVLLDDTTCHDNYVRLSIVALVIAVIGILDFFVHAIIDVRKNSVKKYKFSETPDGKSFEEWQEMQQLIDSAGDAKDKLAEKASNRGDKGE
ncbi:MAG: hypothetical protein K6B74_10165, partial [Ruminococcus sp.]|nr:hypothetical protein [Ruminococcus sp.]